MSFFCVHIFALPFFFSSFRLQVNCTFFPSTGNQLHYAIGYMKHALPRKQRKEEKKKKTSSIAKYLRRVQKSFKPFSSLFGKNPMATNASVNTKQNTFSYKYTGECEFLYTIERLLTLNICRQSGWSQIS